MEDKQRFENEQFEKVSGGKTSYDRERELKAIYRNRVDKENVHLYIGRQMLFMPRVNNRIWYHAVLRNVFERSDGCSTKLIAHIDIIQPECTCNYTSYDLTLDEYYSYID